MLFTGQKDSLVGGRFMPLLQNISLACRWPSMVVLTYRTTKAIHRWEWLKRG